MLGRAYRLEGSAQKTIEILEPVIRTRFDEFRSFVEYVRAMLDLGEPYSKCAAVLSQGQLDGVTDPAYIGLLGGLLFMDGRPDEAAKIFDESMRQGFSYDERIQVQFRPRDPVNKALPLRLSGRVTTVKPTYVFIQNDKYRDFISRTIKVDETILRRGTEVTFQPMFGARGPYADNVRLKPLHPQNHCRNRRHSGAGVRPFHWMLLRSQVFSPHSRHGRGRKPELGSFLLPQQAEALARRLINIPIQRPQARHKLSPVRKRREKTARSALPFAAPFPRSFRVSSPHLGVTACSRAIPEPVCRAPTRHDLSRVSNAPPQSTITIAMRHSRCCAKVSQRLKPEVAEKFEACWLIRPCPAIS